MSRRPRTDRLAIRDQIAAVLRDADEPMTSNDVAEHVRYPDARVCDGAECRLESPLFQKHLERATHAEHFPAGFDVAFMNASPAVVDQPLQALVRSGHVATEKVDGRLWYSWVAPMDPDLARFAGMIENLGA